MGLLTGSNAPRFSQYTAEQFTGTGAQTTFTLSKTPPSTTAIMVSINGVKQHVNTYSVGVNQLIFTEAPYNGDLIECIHLGSQGLDITFEDASITTAKLASGAVTAVKKDIASLSGTGAELSPNGTTAQRPVNPQPGYERFNTSLSCKEIYDGTNWINTFDGMISQYAYGTGGIVTTSGNWRIHTFNSSDSIVFTQGGRIEFLIVAGGGGGGADVPGGGGAGGAVYSEKFPIAAGTYVVTVGAGGAAAVQPTRSGIGGNSSIVGGGVNIVAFGGGAGGSWSYTNPSEGGCGGGADGQDTYRTRSGARSLQRRDLYPNTVGYGNRGGNSGGSRDGYSGGGGGGGIGMPGGNGDAITLGTAAWQGDRLCSAGGDGIPFDISGSTVWYGGGGGGSSNNATTAAYGGRGGGGNADAVSGSYNSGNINGVANTGGGGGARGNGNLGGNGGSGIVIIRYLV